MSIFLYIWDVGIRTESELENVLLSSKKNMIAGLMEINDIMEESISAAIGRIENQWVRESNLIYLLGQEFATDSQKQKAADELARLGFNAYPYNGYWTRTYSDTDYVQNENP